VILLHISYYYDVRVFPQDIFEGEYEIMANEDHDIIFYFKHGSKPLLLP